MLRVIQIILILLFVFSNFTGCSFIQERFGQRQLKENSEQTKQESPEEMQRKKAEPIPVSPQHS